MKSVLKSLIVVAALFLAFAMGGCAQTHYSDGTKAGYCIGAPCLVQALMPAAALDVGRNPNGDFVRPSPDKLKLGQSTYGQVVELMGNPSKSRSEANSDGTKVKIITYSYVPAKGGATLESGVLPVRELSYFFLIPIGGDGGFTSSYTSNRYKLVGQQLSSSFKSDNSNFDETKMSGIVKGRTTQAEVIQLLGMPSASFIAPMVKEASGEVEAIEYNYQVARGATSSDAKAFSKALRIAFDDKGLASDIRYTSSGNN